MPADRTVKYTIQDIVVTKDIMDKFVLSDFQRNIRPGQVTALFELLTLGNHFETPIVVNKLDGKYRIIDGGHRYSALKLLFKQKPTLKVQVKLAVYDKLDAEGEKAVYTNWSLGIKQTIDDMLFAHKEQIELFVRLGSSVRVYAGKDTNAISLKTAIAMLHSVTHESKPFIAQAPKRGEIVAIAKSFTKEQIAAAEEFLKVFIEVFGKLSRNHYAKSVFIVPLFNIYYLNRERDRAVIVERFKELIADTEIKDLLRGHSVVNKTAMRGRILRILNRSFPKFTDGSK